MEHETQAEEEAGKRGNEMKDIVYRVRCWIAWYAMPKEVRPIFIKALQGVVDELLKELKATQDDD